MKVRAKTHGRTSRNAREGARLLRQEEMTAVWIAQERRDIPQWANGPSKRPAYILPAFPPGARARTLSCRRAAIAPHILAVPGWDVLVWIPRALGRASEHGLPDALDRRHKRQRLRAEGTSLGQYKEFFLSAAR